MRESINCESKRHSCLRVSGDREEIYRFASASGLFLPKAYSVEQSW